MTGYGTSWRTTNNRLWIATLSGGLDLLRQKNRNIHSIKEPDQPNSIGSDFISRIIQTKKATSGSAHLARV